MRIAAPKTLISAMVVLFIITLIPACQEDATEERPSDAGRVKLLEFKIAQMETNHATELNAKQKLLDKCEEKNKSLSDDVMKNIEDFTNQMLMPMVEEADKLRKENADLKEQIKQLKGN
jgi:hypothetical protein